MEEIKIRDCDYNWMFPSERQMYVLMSSNEHYDDVLAVFESLDKAKSEAEKLNDENHIVYIVKTNVL